MEEKRPPRSMLLTVFLTACMDHPRPHHKGEHREAKQGTGQVLTILEDADCTTSPGSLPQCFSTLAVKISILYSNQQPGSFCLHWSTLRGVGLCPAGGFLRSSCPRTSPCWPRFHTPQHRRPCSSSACLLQGGASPPRLPKDSRLHSELREHCQVTGTKAAGVLLCFISYCILR